MRTLIVLKNGLTETETFIRRHASDLAGRTLLLFGEPPRSTDGTIHELGSLRKLTLRARRRVIRSDNPRSIQDGRYASILRTFAPDVVLAEYGPSGVAVLRACREAGTPLAVFFHGYDLHVHQVRESHMEGYRALFTEAAAILCGAPSMHELLLELGAPRDRTFVCASSGIDCDFFDLPDQRNEEVRFVHIGRFVDKKAPHLTLLAFSRVLARVPEARLDMIGTGPLLGSAKDLAVGLGIEVAVTFHGHLPHAGMLDVLGGARAFVQHSVVALDGDSEGTALTALEAGACRVPAIVTRHAGFRHSVIDERTGFLIDERDVDAMTDRMLRLARDRELAHAMGREARARVERFFNHRTVTGRLASILEWSADGSSEKPPEFPEWVGSQTASRSSASAVDPG